MPLYSETVENRLKSETALHRPALKNKTPTEPAPKGPIAWIKGYGARLANNIDPLNLYARLKDYYKGIEIIAPLTADWLTRGSVTTYKKSKESKEIGQGFEEIHKSLQSIKDLPNDADINQKIDHLTQKVDGLVSKEGLDYDGHKVKKAYDKIEARNRLGTGVAGDTAFTIVMSTLSNFSGWAEKSQVERVYGKLAEIEFGKSSKELKFNDLKKSTNPMLREAAEYYGKKSFIRSFTDLFGLVRLIPFLAYKAEDKWGNPNSKKLINNTDKGLGKVLNGIANFGEGIKLLMFAKTFFFQWYFSSRQTGSFYEAKEIWNITEGIASSPNRALNENKLPGEFVTRQQIATLYERFREENPKMNLEQFTPDDPLTSRVFEQTARYLNHTYMPLLFKISEPDKQYDLPRKRFTHAMLVELVGSGGLRVEDAISSSLRLEVLAYHGRNGVREGIAKYRELSTILGKINRPTREQYSSQDEAIEAVHDYLSRIDEIGREYLGDYWPPKYMNEELKEGYIKTIFQNADLSQEKFDYMASALFVRDSGRAHKYTFKESNPASALVDTPEENAKEAAREAEHRERKSFTENIERKRPKDVMKEQSAEPSEQGHSTHL